MADERRILAVSVILSLFSALAAAFQCCGVLLSQPPPEAVNGHIVLNQIFTRFGALANVTRPRLGGLPHLEPFTWQNVTPARRVTLPGKPGNPPRRVTLPIM